MSQGPLRVALVSLGCPKALVDSEKMLADLARAGCLVPAPEDEADVILVNTCAFIHPAREESLEAIRRAVARKRRGCVRRVVVAGCLPQREAEDLLRIVPGVDAIVGVFERDCVVEAVTSTGGPFVRVGRIERRTCPDDRGRFRLTPRHTAYLRLAEGCSAGCSFCSIPAIRGPLRSKPAAQVLAEARELVADGAVELNLIAQDTTAYGSDLRRGAEGTGSPSGPRRERADLAALLRRLDAVEGVRWLRLMYANPASLTEPVIDALADCPRVAKYLDLPLQHVSDRILSRMGRSYDRAGVEALLENLRRRVPGIALRTTFLVGFPGERPREFQELAKFVESARFDAVGVMAYWPEPGTRAAGMRGQVGEQTRFRRRRRLMLVQQRVALAANARRAGQSLEVLVDGTDPGGRCLGRHAGQAPDIDGVCVLTRPVAPGRFVRGTVVGCEGYDLIVRPEDGRTPAG